MKRFSFLTFILALCLVVVACYGSSSTPVLPPSATLTPKPEVGNPAPDFVLSALDGTKVTLNGLKGKPVFLNFWSVN